jgi:hypothetical protein
MGWHTGAPAAGGSGGNSLKLLSFALRKTFASAQGLFHQPGSGCFSPNFKLREHYADSRGL